MASGPDAFPFPVLTGDIGGTNARFAVVPDETAERVRLPDVRTADFATIDDAIDHALAGTNLAPKTAILALAGPIAGDHVPLTNSDWVVEPRRLIARFDLSDAVLLNDFEAQSLCLPDLEPEDVERIGGGEALPLGTRLVVGPGTGLGAGALVHARDTWIPVPGEGGHIDFGPVTEQDFALWPHLERLHGRVSGETVLSGGGLFRLYRAVAAMNGVEARHGHQSDVTTAGLSGTDPVAAEALALFAVYLGRFAGDLALVFMPRGGAYLAGGIPPRIAAILRQGAFREAFVAKEPHREILEEIATAIIVKKDAALAGIGAFARKPRRFSLDLGRRHWRA